MAGLTHRATQRHHFANHPNAYNGLQVFMAPYPDEMRLRNLMQPVLHNILQRLGQLRKIELKTRLL
jgi:hypothetical protein